MYKTRFRHDPILFLNNDQTISAHLTQQATFQSARVAVVW